jgi:SAM-dependent methyltransferase
LSDFKDLFSKQSKEYAASRPSYPRALFDFLAGLVQKRELAWDCATGNGQAAAFLGEYFDRVIASDASARQIENARAGKNVHFAVFHAEKADIKDGSVDLVTVAQALHWFRFDDFYREVRRVSRRGGVIAAWAYGHHSIGPEVDRVTQAFYKDVVGRYWPAEVKYVENKYEDIPFPFAQISGTPDFQIDLEWSLRDLVGYFYTWSSVQKYIEENRSDPVEKLLYPGLKEAWSRDGTSERKKVTWPIYLKAGRVDGS